MRVSDYAEPYRSILLSVGASLETKVFLRNGYPCLYKKGTQGAYIHRVVAAHQAGVDCLPRTTFVHHINEDRADFRPENLHMCTLGEHNGLHRRFGADNHFYGQKHTDETKRRVAEFAASRTDLGRDEKGRFASC